MKNQHAIHNEDACNYLLESNKFNDWVVTTAFYAALHYVQYELFPLTEEGKTYNDFNTYFAKVLKKQNKRLTKHTATIQLVNNKLQPAASYYRWLHDTCMTTRYSSYIVSNAKAVTAKFFLGELKKHLKKQT
jgi:hypothetical protein